MVDTSLHLFTFAIFLDEVQQISVNTTGMDQRGIKLSNVSDLQTVPF